MELNWKNADGTDEVPESDHYAIVTNGPKGLVYSVFGDRRSWEKAIEKVSGRVAYRAMHVSVAQVTPRFDIRVMDAPVSSGGET